MSNNVVILTTHKNQLLKILYQKLITDAMYNVSYTAELSGMINCKSKCVKMFFIIRDTLNEIGLLRVSSISELDTEMMFDKTEESINKIFLIITSSFNVYFYSQNKKSIISGLNLIFSDNNKNKD